MPDIDTIIFDWGGVLIDDPAPLLLAQFTQALHVAPEPFLAAVKKHAEPFQKGLCREADFWANCCQDLGVDPPREPSLWGRAFRAVYRPKKDVWALVSELRQLGCKTALLSNTEMPGVDYFHERGENPFDALIFSCCEACRKPEPRIYEIALQRLKSRPESAVFIDDNEHYIAGARAVGICGLLFRDISALTSDLLALGLSLANRDRMPE